MFKNVVFVTAIKSIKGSKLSSIEAGEAFRKQAYIPALKVAKANFDIWENHLKDRQAFWKKRLAEIEKMVKTMESPDWLPFPDEVLEVQEAFEAIQAARVELDKHNKEQSEAFRADGFRSEDWQKVLKAQCPLLTDKDLNTCKDILQQGRGKLIADQRLNVAAVARIGEYENRFAILAKTADTLAKASRGEAVKKKGALNEAIKSVNARLAACLEGFEKLDGKVKGVEKTLAAKLELPAKTKLVKGNLGEREENMKKVTGMIKTLTVELTNAERVFGTCSPPVKKEFTPQLQELKRSIANLDKRAKETKALFAAQDQRIVKAGIKI